MPEPLRTLAVISHLGGAGRQDESRQRRQVPGSTEVGRKQRVTHNDVAAQDGAARFFTFARHH